MDKRLQNEEKEMTCVLCKHGETEAGRVTVTLERGGAVIVIKDVPADVCADCGEYYLTEHITDQVMKMAEEAVARNAEVEILRFAA